MRALCFVFFAYVVLGERWLTSSGSTDNDRTRQYLIGCSIKSSTVSSLTQLWKTDLSGNVLNTPTLDGRGGLYVTAYGNTTAIPPTSGTIYKLNEDTGAIIWATTITSCNGVVGAQSRTSPAISLQHNLAIVGDVTTASIMAFDLNTGACVWNTVVDPHPAAEITGSATIQGNRGFVGVSSQENYKALDPTYPCCSFVGSMVSFNVATGAIFWRKTTIPQEDVGIGKYAGASIWGSTPVLLGDMVCAGSGNTYWAPADVQACELLRRANPTLPSCVPPEIKFDSLLCYNKFNGDLIWTKRFDPYDAFNNACIPIYNPTNCPHVVGNDSDFAQAPMLYGSGNRAAVGQKDGSVHILNLETGEVYHSRSYGPGGYLGGFLFGMTANTNPLTRKTVLIGGIVNVQKFNWTLENGTVINSSFWVGIDGETGDVKWQLVENPPSLTRASTSSVNDVAFLCNQNGRISAVNVNTGQILWYFDTGATLNDAPAITRRRIYFGNGYNKLQVGTGQSVYAFTLQPSACPHDFYTDYSYIDDLADYLHEH